MKSALLATLATALFLALTTSPAYAVDIQGYPCWVDHVISSSGSGEETATVELRTQAYCGGSFAGYGAFLYKPGTSGNGYWPKDSFFHHIKQLMENNWRRVFFQMLPGSPSIRVYRVQYKFN